MKKSTFILKTSFISISLLALTSFISFADENDGNYGSSSSSSTTSTSSSSTTGDYPVYSYNSDSDADRVRLGSSGIKVNKFAGKCRNVRKITGDDIFIPLRTEEEWARFVYWAADPSNTKVKVTVCGPTEPTIIFPDPVTDAGSTTLTGGGGGSCPFLFTFKNGKYLVENDVMMTYKHQYYEIAKTAYEKNSGNPLKTNQTDLYKMRLIPDITDHGIRLMVKEIEPEESHIDQVQLIRAVTQKGNNLFVDNQTMSVKAVSPVKNIPLAACSLSNGMDCRNELLSIDTLSIEGKKDTSIVVTFDLNGINKNNLYLTLNSWMNNPPALQTEAFKAHAENDSDSSDSDSDADNDSGFSSSVEACGGGSSFVFSVLNSDGSIAQNLAFKDLHPREIAVPNSIALGSMLSSFEGNTLTLKITWTADHFMDHIGLAEAASMNVVTEELSLTTAIDKIEKDVRDLLLHKDNKYVDLVRGDSIELVFKPSTTTLKDNEQEVYFFASSGFYHGLRTFMHPKVDASMESYRAELKSYVDELKQSLGP